MNRSTKAQFKLVPRVSPRLCVTCYQIEQFFMPWNFSRESVFFCSLSIFTKIEFAQAFEFRGVFCNFLLKLWSTGMLIIISFFRATNVSRWRSNHLVGRRSKLRFKWSDYICASIYRYPKQKFTNVSLRDEIIGYQFLDPYYKLIWLFTKHFILHCFIRYFG